MGMADGAVEVLQISSWRPPSSSLAFFRSWISTDPLADMAQCKLDANKESKFLELQVFQGFLLGLKQE